MTPEDPISQIPLPEKASQEELKSRIQEYLESDFIDDKFKGIEMIHQVTDPETRAILDEESYNIIDTLLYSADKDSTISIANAIEAVKHIPYVQGQYGTFILRRASETYRKLDSARRKDPKNENLKRFFLEVDKN